MNYNHHMSYVQHEQNQEQMHNDIMQELDEKIEKIETLYTNYCKHCKENNITPKSFNEWMHTEPTCTEPLHNHHDGCPVCDMPY
jgi:hypothetical protein